MSKMTVKNSALYVNITPKAREFLEKCDRQTQKKYEGAESIDIDEIKDLIVMLLVMNMNFLKKYLVLKNF